MGEIRRGCRAARHACWWDQQEARPEGEARGLRGKGRPWRPAACPWTSLSTCLDLDLHPLFLRLPVSSLPVGAGAAEAHGWSNRGLAREQHKYQSDGNVEGALG